MRDTRRALLLKTTWACACYAVRAIFESSCRAYWNASRLKTAPARTTTSQSGNRYSQDSFTTPPELPRIRRLTSMPSRAWSCTSIRPLRCLRPSTRPALSASIKSSTHRKSTCGKSSRSTLHGYSKSHRTITQNATSLLIKSKRKRCPS